MDDGFVLGHRGKVFSFDPRTGQKIDFTPTPGGWDLTLTLEPPEKANKVLNKQFKKLVQGRRLMWKLETTEQSPKQRCW